MELLKGIADVFQKFEDRISLKIAGKEYSYGHLKARVSALSHGISGSDPDQGLFGIWASDDIDTYASILALLFAGKGYVPLHPQNPSSKNRAIIGLSGIRQILIPDSQFWPDDALSELVEFIRTPEFDSTDSMPRLQDVPNDRIAYLLFTSGSTGEPKGVPITRKNLDAFIRAFNRVGYPIAPQDRCLQMFDLTFDFSVASLFTPLFRGASLFTIPQSGIRYNHILRLLLSENLTVLPMVPSLLNHLSQYYSELPMDSIQYCYFCGEALPENTIQLLSEYALNARFINFYGPTEATVFSTAYEWIPRSDRNKSYNGVVSIGKPMLGFECRVVDVSSGDELNPGEKGELVLSGPQVTPGYWSDPAMNELMFLQKKEGDIETVWYRTGDLAFYDSEGDFYYAGRLDQQVQIQGFRVELGEIEYFAKDFTGLPEVYAIAYKTEIESLKIHLFIKGKADSRGLIKFLKLKLPDYMVPSGISTLDEIPLNRNGKVDRTRLAEMAGETG